VRLTIKLGGSILEQSKIRISLLREISELRTSGHEVVLVHGGGKALNRALAEMGLESRFVLGLRMTDAATMRVATMVLAGEVNKRLVAELSSFGSNAVGVSGADAGSVRCIPVSSLPGAPQDLGFVGKPVGMDGKLFDLLLNAGMIPVVASIALGADGKLYNVNADQMASICASGCKCESLIYLTDVAGIRGENGEIIRETSEREIASLRARGVVSGGMLPKTESCVEALRRGVKSVYILPGAQEGVLSGFFAGQTPLGTRLVMETGTQVSTKAES
jgi:acetylglutamate kinase